MSPQISPQFLSLEMIILQGVQSQHVLRTLCDAIAAQDNE